MSWSDSGIVLSNRKHGENLKIVSILTQEHGKMVSFTRVLKRNSFAVLSTVDVELIKSDLTDSMGFWTKKYEKQSWVYIFGSEIHLCVCQSICLILDRVLPVGIKFAKIFKFFDNVLRIIDKLTVNQIIILYAYFEFVLLDESGYGFDLENCAVCGKKEMVGFISPKTGNTASEKCCFSYKSKLFKIPEVWGLWKTNIDISEIIITAISQDDLHNSLHITGYFILQNILDFQNCFRETIISKLATKSFPF